MLDIKPSIDIVLSQDAPESENRKVAVVPLSASESLAASRGLAKHLNILYKSVLKNSNPDRALLAVYEYISTDLDRYRQRAFNLSSALETGLAEQSTSRAQAAAAISYLLVGKRLHDEGFWPDAEEHDRQLREIFHQTMRSDDFAFSELADWGFKQSVRNKVYWRRQLEENRGNPHIVHLREAIESSDHYQIAV